MNFTLFATLNQWNEHQVIFSDLVRFGGLNKDVYERVLDSKHVASQDDLNHIVSCIESFCQSFAIKDNLWPILLQKLYLLFTFETSPKRRFPTILEQFIMSNIY